MDGYTPAQAAAITGLPLAAVTLAAAVISVRIAIYIAQPGYRIRHREFRPGQTLAPYSETDHHDGLIVSLGSASKTLGPRPRRECRLPHPRATQKRDIPLGADIV